MVKSNYSYISHFYKNILAVIFYLLQEQIIPAKHTYSAIKILLVFKICVLILYILFMD